MKAVYLTGLRKVEVGEAPAPQLAGPQDVLLRVDTVGVCGSDLHYYRQGMHEYQGCSFPLILGHELGATVLETGPDSTGLKPGQRVAVDPLVACHHCDQCRAGREHTCRHQKFLGYPGQLPGALVEYLVMPADCCTAVPDSLNNDEVAAVEPLSIGVYAAQLAQLAPGARVGIVGSGPIGLCVLRAVQASVPAKIYATDLVEDRVRLAKACGAEWSGNPAHEDVVGAIRRFEPLALDVVFECAGEQDALDQCAQLLKPGGTLLIVGIPEVERVSFNASLLRRNEIRILNVRRQNHCIEAAINLIASRRVDVNPLITHHFSLESAADAFSLVSARSGGVVKAMIRVSPPSVSANPPPSGK